MKNTIKTFALFLTAGAMLASCDSYLDRQPDEPLTSDNIFKKQKTTLQYLTNIYSYQPDYEAPACVSNSNDIPWEASSDETSFAYLDRAYTQINYNSWNPSLPIYRNDTYNTPYKGIREANYFMQNVHKCPPEELNDVDKGYYYNEAFLRHDAARLRSRLPHRRRSGGLHAERTRPARAQHLGRVRQLRRERALGSRQGAARQLARHLLRPCHERRRPGSTRPPATLLGPQALQRQRTLQGYRQQKRRPPVPDPVRRKEMGAGSPGRQRRYEPEPLLAGRRRRHGPLRQLQHALHVGRFRDRRYGKDLHAHRQRLPAATA